MSDFRKSRLDPEALKTFVAVANTQSFSEAAQVLHKTTSAISYRIKTLEDNIGAALFTRTTRTVKLTPAGEILLEKASQIFEWLHTLPGELKQVSDGIEPQFTMVFNSIFYDAALTSRLLCHLKEKFPFTDFRVRSAVYMGVWDAMIHGNGHFGIGAPGFHSINNELETAPLGFLSWVFVIAPDHPLVQLPEPLHNNQLRLYPAINVEDSSIRLAKRTAWRLSGQREILVADFPAKIACHQNGVGIGFLPMNLVAKEIKEGSLIAKQVLSPRSPSPFSAVWKREGAGQITRYLTTDLGNQSSPLHELLKVVDTKTTSEKRET